MPEGKLPEFKPENTCSGGYNSTAYIYGILIGATAFALVLRSPGGDEVIESILTSLPLGAYGIMVFILFCIFLLGFFLDWIEITLIILPLVAPVIGSSIYLSTAMAWWMILPWSGYHPDRRDPADLLSVAAGGFCTLLSQGHMPGGDYLDGFIEGGGAVYHSPAGRPAGRGQMAAPGHLAAGSGLPLTPLG